jgi:hypothetical protein
MKSSSKRVLALLLLTAGYWLIALVLLALTFLPECLTNVTVCETSKRSFAALVLGLEVVLYALLLFAVSRLRGRTHWIVLLVVFALMAAVYLGGLGLY